jgi:hypothetical protein
LVNGNEEPSVSAVRLKIANTGNKELESLMLHLDFGESATAHVGQIVGDIGVYKDKLKMTKDGSKASIEIGHINKGQSFEVEFLVGKYNLGNVKADMAAFGIELKQTEKFQLEAGLSKITKGAISASIMGVRYDSTAVHTANLANEVKLLRSTIANIAQKNA